MARASSAEQAIALPTLPEMPANLCVLEMIATRARSPTSALFVTNARRWGSSLTDRSVYAARRCTVNRELKFSGIGLHSGKECDVSILPARAGYGIVFRLRRKESSITWTDSEAILPGDYKLVDTRSPLCTELVPSDVNMAQRMSVRTVEHCMAALWASGVSDCEVVVEGQSGEMPILDGSALEFAAALFPQVVPSESHDDFQRGSPVSATQVPTVRVLQAVRVENKGSIAELRPREHRDDGKDYIASPTLCCTVRVDSFDGRLPCLDEGNEWTTVHYSHTFGCIASKQQFLMELAPARTFTFQDEIAALLKAGLALGGTLDNAAVFSGDGTIATLGVENTNNTLRFQDEWARHKLLDCLGDLALSLTPHGALDAELEISRPGHATNNLLLHELFKDPDNYALCYDS